MRGWEARRVPESLKLRGTDKSSMYGFLVHMRLKVSKAGLKICTIWYTVYSHTYELQGIFYYIKKSMKWGVGKVENGTTRLAYIRHTEAINRLRCVRAYVYKKEATYTYRMNVSYQPYKTRSGKDVFVVFCSLLKLQRNNLKTRTQQLFSHICTMKIIIVRCTFVYDVRCTLLPSQARWGFLSAIRRQRRPMCIYKCYNVLVYDAYTRRITGRHLK